MSRWITRQAKIKVDITGLPRNRKARAKVYHQRYSAAWRRAHPTYMRDYGRAYMAL